MFANLAARPEGNIRVPEGVEGPEWVPEETQKEGPPVSFLLSLKYVLTLAVIQRCTQGCGATVLGNDGRSAVLVLSFWPALELHVGRRNLDRRHARRQPLLVHVE